MGVVIFVGVVAALLLCAALIDRRSKRRGHTPRSGHEIAKALPPRSFDSPDSH